MIFLILLRLLGVSFEDKFPAYFLQFESFFYSVCRRYEVTTDLVRECDFFLNSCQVLIKCVYGFILLIYLKNMFIDFGEKGRKREKRLCEKR